MGEDVTNVTSPSIGVDVGYLNIKTGPGPLYISASTPSGLNGIDI